MRLIKGGVADKAGIKYEPNVDSTTFSDRTLDLEEEILEDNPFSPEEQELLKYRNAMERGKED